MITITTTSDMTVSWNIAYGKNFFPRDLTSALYWRKTRWRSTTLSLGTLDSCAIGRHGRGAVAARPRAVGLGLVRARARRVLRPRRRGHAEADHEVEVQRDQRDQPARDDEHVDRVEARQRVRVDRGASL